MSLDPLYSAVSWVLLRWHDALIALGLDPAAGTGWTWSVVLLVVTARLLLVPVAVAQFRGRRRLQRLQPQLADLRRRHGHDRAEPQRRTVALHREQGVSPLAGTAPALLQLPVFLGLVHVLRHLAKAASPAFQAAFPTHLTLYGFTAAQSAAAARADLGGAPLAATFRSSAGFVHDVLGGDVTTARLLLVVLLVLAALATVAGQVLARRTAAVLAGTAAPADAVTRRMQGAVLVGLPVVTLAAELLFDFPLGVALYLVTTAVWTCGQQAFAWLVARAQARRAGEPCSVGR